LETSERARLSLMTVVATDRLAVGLPQFAAEFLQHQTRGLFARRFRFIVAFFVTVTTVDA
jgi:hypothetical protein